MKYRHHENGTGNRLMAWFLVLLLLLPFQAMAQQKQALRILVLGTDRLGYRKVSEDEEMSRADAIMAVTVLPGAGGIRVLNIERDYKVDLPDGLGINKLSTTTYFGGPRLLMDSVNALFETDFHYYIQIDIPGAIGIIDSIGGIDVEAFDSEMPILHKSPFLQETVAGMNHLTGEQAQAFMRVRDTEINVIESNSARNERQMRVVTAILRKLPQLGMGEVMAALTRVLPLIQTNIPVFDLLLFAQSLMGGGMDMDISYLRSPSTPFKTKRMNMHQVVLVDDMQAEIAAVKAFLLYPSP